VRSGIDAISEAIRQKDEENARLLEENGRLRAKKCEHGWRGSRPEEGERIRTPCPACGMRDLFIGTGGYLTCSSVPSEGSRGCPSPSVAETWEDQKARIEAARALAGELSGQPHPYSAYGVSITKALRGEK